MAPQPAAAMCWADGALFAVAAIGLLGALTGIGSTAELVRGGLWVVAFAAASVGHVRTDSVWVPVASLASLLLSLRLLGYVEALLGVAPA